MTVEKGRSTPTPRNSNPIIHARSSFEERCYIQGLRSPVVEDTLSDIEEAISEITNRQNRATKAIRDHERRHHTAMPPHENRLSVALEVNDSASEYSVQEPTNDVFISDDEEDELEDQDLEYHEHEEIPYTRADVVVWTPAQVSQYLQSRQISLATCIKFEEQEVTGSILLQLEMTHLKELELGSFGKRFEVWKEIENLVTNLKQPVSKTRCGSDTRASTASFLQDEFRRQRRSTSDSGSMMLPRIHSQHNRQPPRQHRIDVQEANLYHSKSMKTPQTSTTISSDVSSPRSLAGFATYERPRSPPISPMIARPSSDIGVGEEKHKLSTSSNTGDSTFTGDSGFSSSTRSIKQGGTERNYFSSGESTTRKFIQKKNGWFRRTNCIEEQRLKRDAANSRHSRIVSAGAEVFRSAANMSAAISYHKSCKEKHKRKSASFSGDLGLSDYEEARTKGIPEERGAIGRALSPATFVALPFGSLPITETLKTNLEDSKSPISPGRQSTSTGDGSVQFSLDSETVAIFPELENLPMAERKKSKKGKTEKVKTEKVKTEKTKEKTKDKSEEKTKDKSEKKTHGMVSGLREKPKHQTSAFRKGLQQITPAEAALAGDFSGWMKKRGSSGVGTWKARFFVLTGRRLSYYYSEKDTVEGGFIDITSHRVLPASEDRLVGIHAAIAAVASPVSSARPIAALPKRVELPATLEPSVEEREAFSSPPKKKEKDNGWFTFKLVPPGPGAAKGVTFSAPRLHYFATNTREEGKRWMGAMMKATIDRDETKPVVTSYNAKTISLSKARALRARPPALTPQVNGLGIEMSFALGFSIGDMAEDADGEEDDEGRRDSGSMREGNEAGGMLQISGVRDDGASHTTVIIDDEDAESELHAGETRGKQVEDIAALVEAGIY